MFCFFQDGKGKDWERKMKIKSKKNVKNWGFGAKQAGFVTKI